MRFVITILAPALLLGCTGPSSAMDAEVQQQQDSASGAGTEGASQQGFAEGVAPRVRCSLMATCSDLENIPIEDGCPDATWGGLDIMCAMTLADLEPIGCGPVYAVYVECASNSFLACSGALVGCEAERANYLACKSSFARTTSCSRSPAADPRCDSPDAYGFTCLAGNVPDNCMQLGPTTLCCEPFSVQCDD